MPFLAPLALPLISSAVSGIAGKIIGGPSSAQQDSNGALREISINSGNQGLNFLDQSRQATSGPQSYFQSILNGNMGQPTAALAPDINRIRAASNNTLQTSTNLSPRGGARSSTLFQTPSNTESSVQGLFNVARPGAADSLARIGLGVGGIGTSAIGTSISGQANLQRSLQEQQQHQYQVGSDIGKSVYNIGKTVDWSKVFTKPTGSGGDDNPWFG